MGGDGKLRKKGADKLYILYNGKVLISAFEGCISRCSLSVPFTPGENTSLWTLLQNGNVLYMGKIVMQYPHFLNCFPQKSMEMESTSLFFTESLSLLQIDLRTLWLLVQPLLSTSVLTAFEVVASKSLWV